MTKEQEERQLYLIRMNFKEGEPYYVGTDRFFPRDYNSQSEFVEDVLKEISELRLSFGRIGE